MSQTQPQQPRTARKLPLYGYQESFDETSAKRLPRKDQEAPSNSRNQRMEESPVKASKADKRIIALIIGSFAVLTIVLGIMQLRYRKKAENRRYPEIVFIDYPGYVVLYPNESIGPGEFITSPSGKFRVGLKKATGNLVLEDIRQSLIPVTVWSANVVGGERLKLQSDGNLVIQNRFSETLWSSGSHEHEETAFVIDDGGRIGVTFKGEFVWMQGVPRAKYTGPSSPDLSFPVRGAFYYAWYPQTWKVSTGQTAHFKPDLGYYVSGDPDVIKAHVNQFDYGNIDLGIISWFGPGTNLDIARITQILDRTVELGSNVKWALYYEDEWALDPSQSQLRSDFEYVKKWFAWHPAFAHVNGKPLMFVWNEDDCEVIHRWVDASNGEWFLVPKLFNQFLNCPSQPDNWHQYGPASAFSRFRGHSVSISPGFWHAREATARLPRLSENSWCDNVQRMVNTGEPWQLITTFNEAGEGTGIEPTSEHWPSDSGYGYYLDCLHAIS